ncbi:DUF1643 domain-containing protein [Mycoplana rhizolycopersici]|uniref:DUF1643 domain-containing protein n=1 Tax=Mycoplana rhizolycopersici TaxID=2746702 RepID=A0ABX2QFU6_9HYPH|nr:DUF1643 domain-containing protein [Rhizobium rhizolycopersici]NVP56615.1 DUF1643 domain-containing protein [Rhizobium rhizolycopersici]
MTGLLPEACASNAVVSPCGRYRYALRRRWSETGGIVAWIMLNPSQADASSNDPTIRRCLSFSRQWGYGAMIAVNLYGLRATNPDELYREVHPIGPENDTYLAMACREARTGAGGRGAVVAAWGSHPLARARAGDALRLTGNHLHCLGTTANGSPRHPLYVPSAQPLVSYRPAADA